MNQSSQGSYNGNLGSGFGKGQLTGGFDKGGFNKGGFEKGGFEKGGQKDFY